MTRKERNVYIAWNKEMSEQAELRNDCFKALQDLCRERGGVPSCSLEQNLDFLVSLGDAFTKNRALLIYRKYFEASGRYDALMKLSQAFANIRQTNKDRR